MSIALALTIAFVYLSVGVAVAVWIDSNANPDPEDRVLPARLARLQAAVGIALTWPVSFLVFFLDAERPS